MEETAETGRGRARKQTAFFEAATEVVKKVVATQQGSGIELSENPHFCKELDKLKSDNEVCKALHGIMYGTAGKKNEIKKNLRNFSGFPESSVSSDDRKTKIAEKKKMWTTALLKSCLGALGLEKGGDREMQVGRLVDLYIHISYISIYPMHI
jgi:chaperonin cofactor prefoldin